MSQKSWTFTSYENGEPVATEHDLDNREARAAIRAAMSGEPVAKAVPSDEDAPHAVTVGLAALAGVAA